MVGMPVAAGLDLLIAEDFDRLKGKKIGLVCNQASISRDIRHVLDIMLPAHRAGHFQVEAVFGPEHGLFGHTQDNMIEWEGALDQRTGLRIHSLYGKWREPQAFMLDGIDELVVDLPDIGSRYYTFVWTMALCMKACEPLGIPVTVLDRPNPIGGEQVEGTVLGMGFDSFVGQYPLPTRHGMTIGEIARYLQAIYFPKLTLEIIEMKSWERGMYWEHTGLPWAMPSPNMPTVDTAVVYPGACLLEATNLSEGRGTTRPFEIFGAPFLDSFQFAQALNRLELPGCAFRALPFEPTFNKHSRQICGGCQLHVTSRAIFEPVLTYIAILQETIRQSDLHDASHLERSSQFLAASAEMSLPGFAWKLPPYEYVQDRRPIDILAGNDWLEPAISNLESLTNIRERMIGECEEFSLQRRAALIYT
jgi:uncharacterized protein YbbC (DUF1343 family)